MNGENVNSAAVWHISSFLSFKTNQIYFQSLRTATETRTSWTVPSRTLRWTTTTLRTMEWRSPRETSWKDSKVFPLLGAGRVRTRARPWPPRIATWPSSRASPALTRRRRTRAAASQWRSSELDVTRQWAVINALFRCKMIPNWRLLFILRCVPYQGIVSLDNFQQAFIHGRVFKGQNVNLAMWANNKIWPTRPVPAPSPDNLPDNNFERNWQH